MSLSFQYSSPDHADSEILNDYYAIHGLDTRNSADTINKVLGKYGYPEETDSIKLLDNLNQFKDRVDSDVGLTWRRVKMLDIGTLGNLDDTLNTMDDIRNK